MDSSDESKKEKETNMGLMENNEINEVNDLASQFTYFEFLFINKKLNNKSNRNCRCSPFNFWIKP